jgi:predicted lipoprotein with Yx(FWY)xxD motif
VKRILPLLIAGALVAGLTVSVGAAAAPSRSSATAKLKIAFNKKLKRWIVVDARGISLYMFQIETDGTPVCTPQQDPRCAVLWPPLTTVDPPIAGRGIRASLLGTATWPDGTLQVTYRRHPLYYFHGGNGFSRGDRRAGQIRGQGIAAVWWVLSPKGKAIRRIP